MNDGQGGQKFARLWLWTFTEFFHLGIVAEIILCPEPSFVRNHPLSETIPRASSLLLMMGKDGKDR